MSAKVQDIRSLVTNLNNQFSSKFLLNILKSSKDGPGKVVSPLSAVYPLMMTYLGSNKNTKNELGRCFQINDSDEDLLGSLIIFSEFMNRKTESHVFNLVNGMFIDNALTLHDNFKKSMEKVGTIDNVDFKRQSEQVRDQVNQWISDNTNGLIPELFPKGSISPSDVAIIVNTLYFKGKWMHKADETIPNWKFATSTGTTQKDMMSFEEMTCRYYEDANMKMVAMPYKFDHKSDSPRLEMVVVVPKKHLKNDFNLSNFNDNYPKMKPTYVTVMIPKFEQRTNLSLVDTFKQLGVVDLFNESRCDLTKMARAGGNISVSDIIQEVVVIVDEKGTEAAAATAVKCMAESCMINEREPIMVLADHTFEYYIVDSVTGMVAFSGVYDG